MVKSVRALSLVGVVAGFAMLAASISFAVTYFAGTPSRLVPRANAYPWVCVKKDGEIYKLAKILNVRLSKSTVICPT